MPHPPTNNNHPCLHPWQTYINGSILWALNANMIRKLHSIRSTRQNSHRCCCSKLVFKIPPPPQFVLSFRGWGGNQITWNYMVHKVQDRTATDAAGAIQCSRSPPPQVFKNLLGGGVGIKSPEIIPHSKCKTEQPQMLYKQFSVQDPPPQV